MPRFQFDASRVRHHGKHRVLADDEGNLDQLLLGKAIRQLFPDIVLDLLPFMQLVGCVQQRAILHERISRHAEADRVRREFDALAEAD